MSSNPSPAPTLIAVRINKNTVGAPDWVANGHEILCHVHCSLCNIEYVIAAASSNGNPTDELRERARQIVLLTHPRHPEVIDLDHPWG